MASIQKLTINGFRTYCCLKINGENKEEQIKQAQKQQSIIFGKPLTLIQGPNGAGKTTIIECLKLATTGQYPPGSDKGKNFITDCQLLRQTETQAMVELKFLSKNSQEITVRRHYKVSEGPNKQFFKQIKINKKTRKLTFNQLRTTLYFINQKNGEPVALDKSCAHLDKIIPQLIGVSTPVLENIIFCHHEEQFWMFKDNETIKELFDQLFETEKFSKMQEWIKESVKKLNQDIKKTSSEIILRKRDMEDTCRVQQFDKLFVKKKDNITKSLQELVEEKRKLNQSEEKFGEFVKKTQNGNLNVLIQTIQDTQSQISILQYRIQQNNDASKQKKNILRDEFILKDEFLLNQESQIKKDIDTFIDKKQSLELQLSRMIRLNDQQNKEFQTKTLELQQLQESDSLESTYQQELKQLKNQVQQTIQVFKNDSDESILKRIIGTISTLKGKIQQIEDEYEQKIQVINLNHSQQNQKVNEIQVQICLNENKIQQAQKEINGINQDIRQIQDNLIQQDRSLQNLKDNRNALEQREKQHILLQTQVSDLQVKEKEIQQKIYKLLQQQSLSKPIQLYNTLINERNEIKHSISEIDQVILCDRSKRILPALHVNIKDQEIQSQRSLIMNSIANLKKNQTQCMSKLAELNAQVKQTQDKLDQLMNENLANPQMKRNFNYQQALVDCIARYKEAKWAYMRYEYSSGEFIEQYIQGATSRKSCIICLKPMESHEIQAFKDRQQKNQAKVKEGLKERKARMENLKNEKNNLKVNKEYYLRLEQNELTIQELKKQLQDFEIKKFQFEQQNAQVQEELQILEEKLDLIQQIKPLVSQKQNFSDKFNLISGKIETLLIQNPGIDRQNSQQNFEQISSQINEYMSNQQEVRKQIEKYEVIIVQKNQEIKEMERLINQNYNIFRQIRNLEDSQKQRLEEQKQLPIKQQNLQKINVEINQYQQQIPILREKLDELSNNREQLENQKKSILELREEGLKGLRMNLSQLEFIQPQFQKAIEKVNEFLRNRKNKQKDYLQEQKNKLTQEIGFLEQKMEESSKMSENLQKFLKENNDKIYQLEIQIELINLLKENINLNDQIFQMSQDLKNDLIKQQELVELQREKDRQEVMLQNQNRRIQDGLSRILEEKQEVQSRFKNSEVSYLYLLSQEEQFKVVMKDLENYRKIAEDTLIKFHREKIDELNKSIMSTWESICSGDDIAKIYIASEEYQEQNNKNKKAYRYRIVMETKSGVEMDMRGRCSTGQRVLASIVIRMALSECFGNSCGVLALDEPTTNLDQHHIKRLAKSLCKLIEQASQQKQNLQLIIITHDLQFVKMLKQFTNIYYSVYKKSNGLSAIEEKNIDEIEN